MANRIQIRRDTAANWTTINPILADGELGLESDTGKLKSGNGSLAWADLNYMSSDQLKNETASLSFGNDGILYPQGSLPNQGLKITPTSSGSGEDYHVHLTSGDHDTIAIILGDDNSYVGSISGAVGIGVNADKISTYSYDYSFWGSTWGDIGLDQSTETGASVVYDDDGNLYVVGTIDNRNTANYESLILKYNPTGQLVWQRGWANTSGPVCALNESIAFAYNKMYYVANGFEDVTYVGTNNLDGSLDSPIFYVAENTGIDIIVDNDNPGTKVFVGGVNTLGISTLMKIDLSTSAINAMISVDFGHTSQVECITQDNSGYVYAIHGGTSVNTVCYLTKHDSTDLSVIWQKVLLSVAVESYGIAVGFNQGFVYALTRENFGSAAGGSLRKITQNGALVWSYQFNNSGSTDNLPSDISFDTSGNIYITAVDVVTGKMNITKLTKTGTVVWSKLVSNDTGGVVSGNIVRGWGHRSGDIFEDRIAITGFVSRANEGDLITVQLPIDGSIETETQEWNIENFTWTTSILTTNVLISNVTPTITPLTPSTGTFTGSITVTDSTIEYSTNTVTFESRPTSKFWAFMSDGNIILPPGDHDIKEYDFDGGLYSALDNRESYTVRQFVSAPIFFSKIDYQDPNPGDFIDVGINLKRGNNQALYNSLSELNYSSGSPAGTEWNWDGWDDLSNVNNRKYTSFNDALNGYIDNHIVGAELVMHDTINNNYWTFKFLSWTQGSNGGGYSYVRRQINSRDLVKTRGITYNNGTVQTTAYTPIVKQHYWDDQAEDGEVYEIGLRDCGKHIYATGTYGDTIKIPNWSTVEFPIGTLIYIATQGNNISVTYDTEVTIWGSGLNLSNQSWIITPHSLGTLLCVEPDVWILSSTGLDY